MAPGGLPRRAGRFSRPADMQSKQAFTRAPIVGLQQMPKPDAGGDEPWPPKKQMSSSWAWARWAEFSRPNSAKRE